MSHNEMDGGIHISATSSCGRHPAVQTLGVYSDLPMPTKSPLCLLPACVNIPELFTTLFQRVIQMGSPHFVCTIQLDGALATPPDYLACRRIAREDETTRGWSAQKTVIRCYRF